VARVLFVENHGDIVGGGQISLLGLMGHLSASTPEYVCPAEGTMTEAVRQAGIPVRILAMPPLRPANALLVAKVGWRLSRMAREGGIDLIHANGTRGMFYAGLAGLMARLPVLWHVRVVESDGWWDRVLSRLATRIIAVSEAVRRRFHYLRTETKIQVVHNGVDLQSFVQGHGMALRQRLRLGDGPLVGMVAQLIPLKRQEDFIRAAALVAPTCPEARFLVIGAEPEAGGTYECKLRDLVEELELGERLIFTGFLQEAPDVMAMLDLVTLTSRDEAFGRVLIEAMAASRPVVATRGGGVPEIVVDGETGLLVRIGDVEGIAAAITSLLAAPERRRAMGAAGHRRALAHFSIEAHAGKVEALYRQLVEKQEPRSLAE